MDLNIKRASKIKKVSASKEISTNNKATALKNLDSINIAILGTKGSKKSIYKYEASNLVDERERKTLRRNLRNKRNDFARQLITLAKDKTASKELKKVVKTFNVWYKDTYCIADYKIENVTQTKNSEMLAVLSVALQIAKENS